MTLGDGTEAKQAPVRHGWFLHGLASPTDGDGANRQEQSNGATG